MVDGQPVDVVVPAHNEAATIVVADHCTDDTAAIAHAAGVDAVLSLSGGPGDKGTAMARGLALVASREVLFIDADLHGLAWQHVEYLATAPPHGGQLCGLRDEPIRATADAVPPITGERRVPSSLARSVKLEGSGYRAETLLNAAVGRARLPHRNVVLLGVTNPTRATGHPVSWLTMWADLAAVGLVNLPGLVAYAIHPEGR